MSVLWDMTHVRVLIHVLIQMGLITALVCQDIN